MPRFIPLRRRLRAVGSRAIGHTLVLLAPVALLVPRTIVAETSSVGGAAAAPAAMPSVSLTHDGNGTASVNTNSSSSTTFTLTSLSASTLTVNLVVTVCNGAVAAGSCTRSPTSVSLPSGASTTITVGFSGGSAPGSGTVTLAAKNTSGSTLASSSVSVTVAQPIPTVSAAPHVGDRRDVGMCVADCFESILSYSTPAYTSLDVPRSVTLLYRSGRAFPFGTVTLDASDPYGTATKFRLKLKDANGAYVTFSNNATELYFSRNTTSGQSTRLVAQFKATTIPTSAALYTAEVAMFWPSPSGDVEQGTSPATVRVVIINDQNSPFGAGVELVGLQQLFTNQSGGVLVTEGSGSATFFSGSCSPSASCSFTSPAGEFSTLSTPGNGTYRRVYPDGTALTFNSAGYHTATADRFGTTTQITYGTTTTGATVPGYITDPASQNITFWYRDPGSLYGVWKEGTLGNIHTPMGDAPIGIDGNNNVREWDEMGGGYHWRMVYLGQHLIDTAYDKANSPWHPSYRYGATVAYIEAPAITIADGTAPRPRVSMRNGYDALLAGAAAGGGTSASPLAVPTESRALVIGPRGDTTFFRLNRFGSADTVKAPLTNAASAQYDPLTGQVLRTVSPNGDIARYTWSANKLTQSIDSTAGKTVNYEYDTQYSLLTHIYGSVAEQWLTYDHTKTGWPLQTSKVGLTTATPTTYMVDQYGRPTSVTDPSYHTTTYSYQTSGLYNLLSVTTPNAQTSTVGRDAWGRVVSSTDRDGHTSSTALDILNRPGWVAGSIAGDTTRYQYDALNNVTKVTDAKNQVYTYQRNALGWVTKFVYPGTIGADSTAYDVAGNPVYVRTRAGHRDSLEYDLLGRVTKKIGLTGADTITYAYDINSRWVAARTVSGGALVSTDTIYSDSVGRTTQEVSYRPGVGSWAVTSAYQADKPGRVSSNLYGGINVNRWVEFWYDASQRPSQIRLLSGNSVFGYNGEDLPTTIQFPSGLTETTSYTSSHVLSRREYSVQAVKDSLDRAYRTDSLGRLVERANGSGTKYQTFTYINDRLTYWEKRHQTGTPTCTNLGGWGYDCSGSSTISDQLVSSYYDLVGNPNDGTVTLDSANRLLQYNGVSMLYDADGNLVRRIGTTTDSLLWDDFGQLTEVRQNGTTIATFAYDGFGRRIRKWSSTAGSVHYIWDGSQLAAEANGSGAITQTYTYYPGIDQLHSVTSGGQTYYASIEPATGDVNGLINGSTNAVVASYGYTPWGEIESSSQTVTGVNSLRWKGLIWDEETKLYYMRARYYDPKARRFISEDPIGLSGGINMYAFGGGDPVNSVDPSGTISYAVARDLLSRLLWDDLFAMYSGGGGGGGNPGERSRRGRDEPQVNARHDRCEVAVILSNYISALDNRGFFGLRPGTGFPRELDFKYQTPNDLYEVNGRWLRADEFGNLAAGYAAETLWGDLGWAAMRVGGIYYANSRNAKGERDSGEHWSDLESAPAIDEGAGLAYRDQAFTGSIGTRGGVIRRAPPATPLTSGAGCSSN